MGTVGIISEYDPFHLGHLWHIEQAKKKTASDSVIVVMSGALTQRGEPAAIDPWTRASWALRAGADMVLLLPAMYSLAPADVFALGGVRTLSETGSAEFAAFGSECGDIRAIELAARHLANESEEFVLNLKTAMSEGLGYPAAMARTMRSCPPDGLDPAFAEKLMRCPNDSLGIRYCIENSRLERPMTMTAIKRNNDFCSASAIRTIVERGQDASEYVPQYVARDLVPGIRQSQTFDIAGSVALRSMPKAILSALPDMDETLRGSLPKAIARETTVSATIDAVSSRSYTRARIRRIIWYAMLGETEEDRKNALKSLPYIRVLGIKRERGDLLRTLRESSSVPVLTTGKECREASMLDEYRRRATRLDSLALDLTALSDPDETGSASGQWFTRRIVTV